jgi:hypothetical protein
VSRRGIAAALTAAVAAAAALAAASPASPTRAQEFFRKELLADRGTSEPVVDLLRDGGGFVARTVTFADLTKDGRDDAVVRVHSGGAAGVVAIYVFSTHGRPADQGLKAIYRRQKLVRGSAAVTKKHILSFRTSTYAPGDELCCPSETTETVLSWDAKAKRFREVSTQPVPA